MADGEAMPQEQKGSGSLRNLIVEAVKDGRPTLTVRDGSALTIEKGISELDDVDIGPLFMDLGELYAAEFRRAQNDGERAGVKHRFRRLLRPRYGCLLLTSVAPQLVAGGLAASAEAAAEEALQWHDEAVLAEVLIYYNDDGPEELLNFCVAVQPDGHDITQPMERFLVALKQYVNAYGSSVRTKAHLKLISLSLEEESVGATHGPVSIEAASLRTAPLSVPKTLSFHPEPLQLPPRKTDMHGNQDGVGDQMKFREIVVQHLGEVLGLKAGSFEEVHYSAGSDAIGEAHVRATAHLYVIFRNLQKDRIALDYTAAMRETLSRLTIAFALDRMQKGNAALRQLQEREQLQQQLFQSRVDLLGQDIRRLQSRTDEVFTFLAPSVWRSLTSWIDVIGRLSDAKGSLVEISGLDAIAANHNWKDEQYFAALLKLVNYVHEGKDSSHPPSAAEAWYAESKRVRTDPNMFRVVHPIWRCLDRLGILRESAEKKSDICKSILYHQRLKEAFYDCRSLFELNAFTTLFLQLAVGAQLKDCGSPFLGFAERVPLVEDLRADVIVDGLNLLHDSLTGKEPGNTQYVDMQISDGWFTIVFDNRRASEFSRLCQQMESLRNCNKDKHPGYQRHDMSMSLFAALGVNDKTWGSALNLNIDSAGGSVFVCGEDGKCCAANAGEKSLTLSYKMAKGAGE